MLDFWMSCQLFGSSTVQRLTTVQNEKESRGYTSVLILGEDTPSDRNPLRIRKEEFMRLGWFNSSLVLQAPQRTVLGSQFVVDSDGDEMAVLSASAVMESSLP